jgi:hypothetical protein
MSFYRQHCGDGLLDYADKREIRVLVQDCCAATSVPVSADRHAKRSTITACISADGFQMRRFVIVSRATAGKDLASSGYDRHNAALASQENALTIFSLCELWAETVFFPAVEERRRSFRYEGKAVLLLDGIETIESSHGVSREPRGGLHRSATLGWHRRAIALRA